MKKTLAIAAIFVLTSTTAHAAVIGTTKPRDLPTIEHLRVGTGYDGFGFDIAKAPTTDAYDVWGRLTNARGKIVAEWFSTSMKFRRRSEKLRSAAFRGNLGDFLFFERDGAYEFTVFACPANMKKPNPTGCATAKTTVDYSAKNAR